MAEDRLPLHEATLLWCVTLERLASDFFSDARDREAKYVRGKVERQEHTVSMADLAVKGPAGAQVQHACTFPFFQKGKVPGL
jgi:hypothetical protein